VQRLADLVEELRISRGTRGHKVICVDCASVSEEEEDGLSVVIKVYPRFPRLSVANYSTQKELVSWGESAQETAVGRVKNQAGSQLHGSHVSKLIAAAGLPLLAELTEKVATRRGGLIEGEVVAAIWSVESHR
jgi:hypothetical protein